MVKSWIVVADSARTRIFDADSRSRKLTEIEGLVHPQGRAHEQELSSDRPGRAFDSVGGGRHGMSKPVSPHEHEAELFARRIAERLDDAYTASEFKRLQLAAPPAFLGVLRKYLGANVLKGLEKVINKSLVHEAPETIAVHFFGTPRQAKT